MAVTKTCFYCGKYPGVENLTYKLPLYKKLDSKLGIGLTGLKRTTTYQETAIFVDRCEICYREHKRPHKYALITGIVVAIPATALVYYFALRWYIAIPSGLAIGFVGSMIYYGVIYRKRIKNLGIKDENELDSYEPYQVLQNDDWSLFKP